MAFCFTFEQPAVDRARGHAQVKLQEMSFHKIPMRPSFKQFVATVAERVQKQFDPSTLIAKAVRNELIITWLLCIRRSGLLTNEQLPGCEEPSRNYYAKV